MSQCSVMRIINHSHTSDHSSEQIRVKKLSMILFVVKVLTLKKSSQFSDAAAIAWASVLILRANQI